MTDRAPPLTEREREVAQLVSLRWIPKRIAAHLDISESRVYALLSSIAVKVGVPDGEDDQQCIAEWWRANAA